MLKATIAGASGHVGGEILRLLNAHPEIEVETVTANSNVGEKVSDIHPHLAALGDIKFAPTSADELARADVVFMALPHGASAALVKQLDDRHASCRIIDSGADYRLRSSDAWLHYYGGTYAGAWPYGLPELPVFEAVQLSQTDDPRSCYKFKKNREALVNTARIAVPGCYPTASSLALAPGFAADILNAHDVVVVAASGTSGAGRSPKMNLLGSEVMGSISAYAVGGLHRHTPEIAQNLAMAAGSTQRSEQQDLQLYGSDEQTQRSEQKQQSQQSQIKVSFTSMLAPMPRGILAVCSATPKQKVNTDQLHELWQQAYVDESFVRVLPKDQWPTTQAVFGSNMVHMQVTYDEESNRVIAVSAIDNLCKGAAGASVQCANLALGIDETVGLPTIGVAP